MMRVQIKKLSFFRLTNIGKKYLYRLKPCLLSLLVLTASGVPELYPKQSIALNSRVLFQRVGQGLREVTCRVYQECQTRCFVTGIGGLPMLKLKKGPWRLLRLHWK